MQQQTATLIGATGLIGGKLLRLLEKDASCTAIKVIVRSAFSSKNPKVQVVQINYNDAEGFKSAIEGSDVFFCAIGTTMKKVKGDKTAYRKVDYDIPVNAATFCAELGVERFVLVSSVGASTKASGFYLHLKGEVEEVIKELAIPSIAFMRPSMLLGNRKEFRLAEIIGKPVMQLLSLIMPANMRAIQAEDVAKAMVAAAKHGKPGVTIYHYKEMLQMAKQQSSV